MIKRLAVTLDRPRLCVAECPVSTSQHTKRLRAPRDPCGGLDEITFFCVDNTAALYFCQQHSRCRMIFSLLDYPEIKCIAAKPSWPPFLIFHKMAYCSITPCTEQRRSGDLGIPQSAKIIDNALSLTPGWGGGGGDR